MMYTDKIAAQKKSIVFSRWSRKSWAVFSSLGKEVKIAVLKLVVANGFIKKNDHGVSFIDEKKQFLFDEDTPEQINIENPFLIPVNYLQSLNKVVFGGHDLQNVNQVYSYNCADPFRSGKDFWFFIPENSIIKNIINRCCHVEVLYT